MPWIDCRCLGWLSVAWLGSAGVVSWSLQNRLLDQILGGPLPRSFGCFDLSYRSIYGSLIGYSIGVGLEMACRRLRCLVYTGSVTGINGVSRRRPYLSQYQLVLLGPW